MSTNLNFSHLSINDHDELSSQSSQSSSVPSHLQLEWDFHGRIPAPVVPATASSSQPPASRANDAFPLFPDFPPELQDQIFREATFDDSTPLMRFVDLRQAVRHASDCVDGGNCQCVRNRSTYLTFHPLDRESMRHVSHWVYLRETTNGYTRTMAMADVSHQSRMAVRLLPMIQPFPQQQGDWRYTQIRGPVPGVADQNADQIVGEPYRCAPRDLIFVRVPRGKPDDPPCEALMPLFGSNNGPFRPVVHDPLFEQLKSIAVSMSNWEELAYRNSFQDMYNVMQTQHSWQLTAEYGMDNVLEGNYPTSWPTPDVTRTGRVWLPDTPQRHLVLPPAGAPLPPMLNSQAMSQNMHLLVNVFTGLEEIYFIDFDLCDDTGFDETEMENYLATYCRRTTMCESCGYQHEGFPRVWGGVQEMEFAEIRQCSISPHEGSFYYELRGWNELKTTARYTWLARNDLDSNGNPWNRSLPKLKLLAPIPRRRHRH